MKKIHINNDDNYATPPDLYNSLNEVYNFDFDPCPYNEGEIINDGLKIDWGKSNFVNPPYSQSLKEKFVLKGVEEMKKGNTSVFLIPVSTSTKLFKEVIEPNAHSIEFLKGRIKFGKCDSQGNFYLPLNAKGKTQSGTKDSMIVVFKPKKKVVYIAHAISGDVEGNLRSIEEIYRFISLNYPNVIPFCPYYATVKSLNDWDDSERILGFEHNKFFFENKFFSEMWVFGKITSGIITELEWCEQFKIKSFNKII